MAYFISEPVERLIDSGPLGREQRDCDVLVVGSGYGGAIAAMRLAGEGRNVWLFERGREYALGDFPESLDELPGHVRLTRPRDLEPLGYADALFDLRIGDGVSALVGNGLGGTSLINANVAMKPDLEALRHPEWPKEIRDDAEALLESMERIGELLGVTRIPQPTDKLRALEKLAGALGGCCEAAPITVSFEGGRNAVGVQQSPCRRCGNCVTGCNVGAKGTLAMNLLPLARTRGARIFTGATVTTIEPAPATAAGPGWLVSFRRSATTKGPLREDAPYRLHARIVVLAAGTLGSTEILLRSVAEGKIDCSRRLGRRFSTNGDTLMLSYGQHARVGALATSGSLDPYPKNVGPTINGHVKLRLGEGSGGGARKVLLEEGAVPASLARIFAELTTCGSLIQRFVKDGLPAWLREHPGRDPLAIHDEALQHGQVLLGMGEDGAGGVLRLAAGKPGAGARDSRLEMHWPDRGDGSEVSAHLEALDAALQRAGAKGFDGGDYLQNPLWRAVPKQFAQELSGKVPGGSLFTVHPLGGCPMGEDAERGAVNHLGQVFRGDGSLHPGLYVMDGAVMPRPLGVNPFLTIAALAWRATGTLLDTQRWRESPLLKAEPALETLPQSRSVVPTAREPVSVVLTERLLGNLGGERPVWFAAPVGSAAPVRDWLAAEISINISDLDGWLRNPSRPWRATCTLYSNSGGSDTFDARHLEEVARGEGSVRLLVPDDPEDDDEEQRRALGAMLAFLQRGTLKRDARADFGERWSGLQRIARNHARWRALVYDFRFQPARDGRAWRLQGRKELGYHLGKRALWDALVELPVELSPLGAGSAQHARYRGVLKVDLVDLSRRALVQLQSAARTPTALMAVVEAGLFFLRALLQTHFWSFPAPEYAATAAPAPGLPGTLRTRRSGRIEPQRTELRVRKSADEPTLLTLQLTHYPHPDGKPHEPVLLIHGLAHGANVFTTPTIRQPLAAYLHDQGFEPWLLDYRLSPALAAAREQSSMDEIAEFDIAAAVRHVYREAGAPIRVFTHCIGAGCFSMSVLAGHCHDAAAGRSMIRCAAIHAVPPWVVASSTNRLRANLAAFVKDAIGDELVDPVPRPRQEVDWLETLIDRLAGSLSWPDEELRAHNADRDDDRLGHAICNRMTLFYGVEWVHANLSEATHRGLSELVGVGNIETFRQIFFVAQRERITDREGRNAYLVDEHVRLYWTFPTLFSHGTENGVFNPESSRRSAARLRELQEHWFNRLERCPVYLQMVQGYGHMDFLFGANAARDVYPAIRDFLDDERRKRLPDRVPEDPDADPWPSPRCGPVIGHARAAGEGRVALRLWFELREDVTSPAAQIVFTALCEGGPLPGLSELPLDAPSCSWEDGPKHYSDYGCYWVYEVVVPAKACFLRAEVRYGGRSEERRLGRQRAPAPPPSERDLSGEDPKRSAVIDLRIPWFRRLGGKVSRPGGVFLAGSCRHPGSPFEREAADKVFGAMLAEVRRGADHVLLVGDQIYADATADAFDTSEPGERFSGRYRDAFGSPQMRRLLRSAPVYMAIDDHELQDNWEGSGRPPGPGAKKLRSPTPEELYRIALEAAHHYQGWMGPGSERGNRTLWYPFESAGLPFFVLDTRSRRTLRHKGVRPEEAEMLPELQRTALEKWLADLKDDARPKFVVCGTPLGPERKSNVADESLWRASDGWYGYPVTLRWLIETVARLRPQNLVFVSGDYHFSAVAELAFYCDGRQCAEATQIIASGLYSPMPFANERIEDYDWDGWSVIPAVGSGARLGVRPFLLAHGRSHFLRVAAAQRGGRWRVEARAIGADRATLARWSQP